MDEIKDICKHCIKYVPDDMLEAYMDYTVLYSSTYWLILLEEKLRRQEQEIYIL